MNFQALSEKIKNESARVGIIGMGYVGLPLAIVTATKGFTVTGLVRTLAKANQLQKGHTNVDTIDQAEFLNVLKNKQFTAKVLTTQELERQDIIIVCVPTPVTSEKLPDLSSMKSVATELAKANLKNSLIINESTVAPGTTRQLFDNLSAFLACSPERVDPGNQDKNVANIAKVVGGRDNQSLTLSELFYKQILSADVVGVPNLETAEMAKMLENTYRAVNIALINEVALLCEKLGIDVLDVIRAASTKWSFQPHFPGIGVGGHCIPVDPYYLVELARQKNSPARVISAALSRNNNMPGEILKKFLKVYKTGMSVLVYGIAYKKNVADLRESPVLEFTHLLKKRGIAFSVYDPHVSQDQIKSLGLTNGKRASVDLFIVGSDHDELVGDMKVFVSNSTIIIDGRNALPKKIGAQVLGVGRELS